MIYLDNSATTFPKPQSVYQAVDRAMRQYSFNPGRGGYRRSLAASERVYEARRVIKDFFHAPCEEAVIFTPGCTAALNMVIKGVLNRGDHVVISSMEHNAVLRPLEQLSEDGIITYSVAQVAPDDDDMTVMNFRNAINDRTRLFICTHASNVFGFRLPAERLCALAHSYGILFCLDAAQSAGVFEIHLDESRFDYVCCAGHKYLYGPMGTGLLLLGRDDTIHTTLEGGTGSESSNSLMPAFYPDRLEPGTMNIAGIIGLSEGVRYIGRMGVERIHRKETELIRTVYRSLKEKKYIRLYASEASLLRGAPVLSLSVEGVDSESVARYLSESADIAVRSGLHCAPLAHRTMHTLEHGTVRIAPSAFTTAGEIRSLIRALVSIPAAHSGEKHKIQ